jgi:hypothetical protein
MGATNPTRHPQILLMKIEVRNELMAVAASHKRHRGQISQRQIFDWAPMLKNCVVD